jgi:MFS family permease
MSQLRSLLGNRSFLTVWSASVVSGLGDKIAVIALYLLVYHIAGSAVDLGLLAAVQILPAVLLGPVSGLILDRYNRKAVMVCSDVVSTLLVAALPFARSLGEVYLLAGLLAAGRQFSGPARLALVADLVPPLQLDKANALAMVTKNVVMLVGPAVGGAMVALWGTSPAFWLDAATFLASAGLLLGHRFTYLPRREPLAASWSEPLAAGEPVAARAWRGIRSGAVVLWGSARLRFAFLFLGATVFVTAMQPPLVVLFIKGVLERGDAELGLVLSASGLGGIAGALAGGLLLSGRRPLKVVTWLLSVDGLLLMLFAVNHAFWIALLLFGLFGAIGTVAQISLASFLQRETPEAQRGRVFGWLGAFMAPLSLLSVFAGSLSAEAVGVVVVLATSGLFEIVVGLVGRFTLPRPGTVVSRPDEPGAERSDRMLEEA